LPFVLESREDLQRLVKHITNLPKGFERKTVKNLDVCKRSGHLAFLLCQTQLILVSRCKRACALRRSGTIARRKRHQKDLRDHEQHEDEHQDHGGERRREHDIHDRRKQSFESHGPSSFVRAFERTKVAGFENYEQFGVKHDFSSFSVVSFRPKTFPNLNLDS